MSISIKVYESEGEYVASCPELDICCYGFDKSQATTRLKKVIVFYAETATQLGYQIDTREIIDSMNAPKIYSSASFVN